MGAGISRSHNEQLNEMSMAMESTMKSEVDASITNTCTNIQSVDNVSGCTVKFAPQYCKASIIGDTVSDSNFILEAQQTSFADMKAEAEAETSGVSFGANVSSASNYQRNVMNAMQASFQSFSTVCTRDNVGANSQTISNSECTPGQVIEFAKQTTDLSILSSCGVSSSADTKQMQDLSASMAATASAKTTGLGDMQLFIYAIMVIAVVGIIGFTIRARAKAHADMTTAIYKAQSEQRNKSINVWSKVGFISLSVAFISLAVGVLGYFHFDSMSKVPICDAQPSSNSVVAGATSVNPELGGLSLMPAIETLGCNESTPLTCSNWMYHDECGLGACAHADLLTDKDKYKKVQTACNILGIFATKSGGCEMKNLATKLFPSNNQIYGCKRCAEGYFRSDSGSCDALKADDYKHVKEYYAGEDDSGTTKPCGPGESEWCKTSLEGENGLNPNDCKDLSYQAFKHKLSLYKRKCEELNANVLDKYKDKDVTRQCPAKYEEYFKCTKEGHYYTCDGYGTSEDCKNSYISCNSNAYTQDLTGMQKLQDECKIAIEQAAEYDTTKWIVLAIGLGIMGLTGMVAIYAFNKMSKAQTELKRTFPGQHAELSRTQKIKRRAFSAVFSVILLTLSIAGIFIGINLLHLTEVEAFKDLDFGFSGITIQEEEKSRYVGIGWAVLILGIIFGLGFIAYIIKNIYRAVMRRRIPAAPIQTAIQVAPPP